MATINKEPGAWMVYLSIFLCECFLLTTGTNNDAFTEELFIKSLPKGNILNHFQFTTVWNSSIADKNTFTHYRLFPKALGDVLHTYHVRELHLSQTQGLWNYEHWGYPPEDAPPGVELWVWFSTDTHNIDQTWAELVNALSGLFCASMNFLDSKVTVAPRWSFRPAGIASEYYSFDSRFLRYAALPREVVCTENLTPWEKLLPCESQVGLGSLFNGMKLYDSQFQSLGLHVRSVCQDADCQVEGIELKQTLSVVYDMTVQGPKRDYQNWSLKTMFGRALHNTCPMASRSKIYVDITLHQTEDYKLMLSPEPMETTTFKRGGDKRTYALYDLKKILTGDRLFELTGIYSNRMTYGDVTPPPVYAHRFITGYGLEKGGITCLLYNTLDTELTVIYMETVPWYLRVYFSSIHIEAYGLTTKPYKIHYIPGKDRYRSYQLEVVFRLRPGSVTQISMEFDRAFLKWTEYPPDANHGFYVNSAVISTMLPTGKQYTAHPQNASAFGDSMTDPTMQFFLRLHTESLLVSLPTPDFSMPYNVICLACTVVAIAFGSLHNLATRRFTMADPNRKKGNIIQRLKLLFMKTKPDDDDTEESVGEEQKDEDGEKDDNDGKGKDDDDGKEQGDSVQDKLGKDDEGKTDKKGKTGKDGKKGRKKVGGDSKDSDQYGVTS